MRICCPHCGSRASDEFVTIGSAEASRPAAEAGLDAFVGYVHLRDNPAGPHREYWQHVFGCRAWLVVERDTRSHAILGVHPAKERAAGAAQGSA